MFVPIPEDKLKVNQKYIIETNKRKTNR